MQEFFMDYGLYLLVGLLVIIALVFLLSGKRKADESAAPFDAVEPTASVPPAPIPASDPIVAAPVTVAPPVAEPAPAPEPAPEPAAPIAAEPVASAPIAAAPTPVTASADDLLRLKGVGPKLNTLLIELGVTRYAQIAGWTDADIAAIDAKLGNFKGRPVRDHWVDQAKYLAAGDIAGFEAKYGKL